MSVNKEIKPKSRLTIRLRDPKTVRSYRYAGGYNVPCKTCHSPDDVIAYGYAQVINNGEIVIKDRWLCNHCNKTFTTEKKKTG